MLVKVEGKLYRYNAANKMTDNSLGEWLVCMAEDLEEVTSSSLFFTYYTGATLFPHKFPLMLYCKVQFE